MRNRKLAALAAAVLASLPSAAAAEPLPQIVQVTESITLRNDAGAELRVPPGFYVPDVTWYAVDKEVRRLQAAETRLAAENKSLRSQASADGIGWGTVAAIATALALGAGVGAHYF